MKITTLSIEGYGPHANTNLNIPGPLAVFSGESQSGKTRGTVGALALALWGVDETGRPADRALIREGADMASITVGFEGGALLTATLDTDRKQSWTLGDRRKVATKVQHQVQMGTIGANDRLGMAIIAPMYWTQLAEADCARPLRDLLMSVLPPQDLGAIIREWMGPDWEEGFPLHLEPEGARGAKIPGALALQKDANRTEAEAAGALRSATEAQRSASEALRLAEAPAPTIEPPDTEKLAKARAYLEQVPLFRVWEARSSVWRTHIARVAERDREIAAWDARKAKLPGKPAPMATPYDPHAHRAAKADVAKARAAQQAASRMSGAPHPEMGKARAEVARWQALADHPAECPHCGKPTVAGVESREDIARRLDAARMEVARLEAEQSAKAKAVLEAATSALSEAESALAAHDALEGHAKEHAAYEAALAALGARPEPYTVEEPPTNPGPWTGPTITADLIARAEARIRDADGYEAAKARAEAGRTAKIEAARAALQTATERATKAKATHEAAQASAGRVASLVNALRRAPTELAQRGQAILAGPLAKAGITLSWAPEDAPASAKVVEVLVDGRPWHCASAGRQIHADAALRAVLRAMAIRAIACKPEDLITWADLPIIVDNAQSWSGGWTVPGMPLWLLYTEDGPLRVSAE